MTVRNVFVIGPDKKIKLILVYPMSTGRNFDEVLRVIDSLQLTANYSVSTPVNWKQGDDVIIAADRLRRGRQGEVPEGLEDGQALPPASPRSPTSSGFSRSSVADVVPARRRRGTRRCRGPSASNCADVVVRDVLAVDAHRAAAFDEVEARQVVDRRRARRCRPSLRRPSPYARRSSNDTCCGGASSISPAACAASASSGPNHWISSVSAPSAIAVAAGDGADEEPRREPLRGDRRASSSWRSARARRGRRRRRLLPSPRAPRHGARPRRDRRGRRRSRRDRCGRRGTPTRRRGTSTSTTASPSNTSRPFSPSRNSTTVAAGAASTPVGAASSGRRAVAQSSCSTTRSPFSCRARSTFLSNLPTDVFGTSSMNAPALGHLPLRDVPAEELRELGRVDRPRRP